MIAHCLLARPHNRAPAESLQPGWLRRLKRHFVKKTFPLNIEGKQRDRVLDATKHEIRKYMQRQLRVPLPEGVDYWDWDCRCGSSPETAEVTHYAAITKRLDEVAASGSAAFYIELLAKNGVRSAKPAAPEQA